MTLVVRSVKNPRLLLLGALVAASIVLPILGAIA
jgi:hypothetical protein